MTLLLLLAACSGRDDSGGRELFTGGFCPQCHGENRAGTEQGPPLKDLSSRWTPSELTRYLRNPSAYIESSPRLQRLTERYPMVMPTFAMDEETRARLVRYLLKEEE